MSAGELIGRCFAARTATHIAHLRTRSYSAHMALQSFYEGVIPLVDTYAEAYQGHFGAIEVWPTVPVPTVQTDTVAVLKELIEWLVKSREACSKGRTDLANLMDELSTLCAQTVYKLTTLK